jgi:hypothetical protein
VEQDHLIEIRRIKGDSFTSLSANDLLDLLQKSFIESTVALSSSTKKTGGRLRGGPLPLPAVMMSNNKKKEETISSKELFLKGIEPLVKMSSSPNLEARLEVSKMLCDLAINNNTSSNSSSSFLFSSECQDLCFQILDNLINDPSQTFHDGLYDNNINSPTSKATVNDDCSDDIKQFSMMAFSLFCEYDCYQVRNNDYIGCFLLLSYLVSLSIFCFSFWLLSLFVGMFSSF